MKGNEVVGNQTTRRRKDLRNIVPSLPKHHIRVSSSVHLAKGLHYENLVSITVKFYDSVFFHQIESENINI